MPLRPASFHATCDIAGHSSPQLPGFNDPAFIAVRNTHFLPLCMRVCWYSYFLSSTNAAVMHWNCIPLHDTFKETGSQIETVLKIKYMHKKQNITETQGVLSVILTAFWKCYFLSGHFKSLTWGEPCGRLCWLTHTWLSVSQAFFLNCSVN